MGGNKNSSSKSELGLYPKFTTTDSHTSLPRSRSHNGPTNPRKKCQTTPKRKHEVRSKGLGCLAGALADSPRPWVMDRGELERGGVNGSRSKFFSKEMEAPTK
jgi:hypothetical protein